MVSLDYAMNDREAQAGGTRFDKSWCRLYF
jgi:hypothetical protein